MEQNKVTTQQIWFGIFIVILFILGYFVANKFIFKSETVVRQDIVKNIIKEVIFKKPNCPNISDFFGYLPKVTLVKNLNSYGDKGVFVNKKTVVIKSVGHGSEIACGYLYVKAHVSDRPLQLKWEHLYIKPSQFGGHIVTDNAILNKGVGTSTELLFNLSQIKYWIENNKPEIREANWASLLNVSNKVEFEVALNTIHEAGIIDEVSIAYQCWSPETGQKTTDCQLSVENN